MFINQKLETAISAMIVATLNANNITGWDVVNSFSTGSIGGEKQIQNPLIEIVCGKSEPLVPYINTGYDKYPVAISVAAFKQTTTATQLNSVADTVINPFLADNAMTVLASYDASLSIQGVFDMGVEINSQNDSWMATQNLEITVARLN